MSFTVRAYNSVGIHDCSLLWLPEGICFRVNNCLQSSSNYIVINIRTPDPMPSLKMKTKAIPDCLKEKYGLHVCRKSSTISKNPPSHARVVQNAEEIVTCTHGNQDESVVYQDLGLDVANYEELSCEESFFQKQEANVTDSGTVNEPIPFTCTANIDAFFSRILKSVDTYNYGGDDNLYVPLLDSEDSDDSCRHSSEPSDFYISDFIFSGPSIGGDPVFNCKSNTALSYDHEFNQSSLQCDLTEEPTILPFLENMLDIECAHDDTPSEETIIETGYSNSCMAIHKLRSYNQESHINNYPDPEYEWFDPQTYIQNIPDQQEMASSCFPSAVQNEKQNTKPITLVLDLDETLVHSSLEHCDDADFTIPVFFNMKDHIVYVKKRPHLQTFLERVAELFEIVVFTASQSIYAKQLLDILDPDGKLISRRAYRESCIFLEGIYTKDLTVLGVDLAKVVIIDNSPQVFRLQINNGIPITSWFDDASDSALISLIPFLETLIDTHDVRPIIAKKFGNKE